MSESGTGAARPENAAEAEFARYKARMAGGMAPMMIPVMTAPGGAMPGWAVPPSFAAFGGPGGSAASGVRSVGEGLGTAVRLGIELLNAVLASSAGALGGMGMALPQGDYARSAHACHCGCETDCCEVFGCGCCEPGVHGCCR